MKTELIHKASFGWYWSKRVRIRTSARGFTQAIQWALEVCDDASEEDGYWRLPEQWELMKAFKDRVKGFDLKTFVAESLENRALSAVDMSNGEWIERGPKLPRKGKHNIYVRFICTPTMGEQSIR